MSSALLSTDRSTAPATPTVPAKVADNRPYLAAVPDCEPPFDDERSAASRLQQLRLAGGSRAGATAARTLEDPLVRPWPGQRTIGLVRVPDTIADSRVPGWSQEVDIGVRRTTTAELPPATRSGPVLARALVEVLCGQRPLSQLRVHCAPEVFAGLQSRPLARGALGHLLNVRVCEPADGVAEISVAFRRGERVRAIAFRIQGVDGRWRVTALQTG
ncbi:MAG: Rv3235 family protein [Actinomycetota bacterium]|nr:Rv3235 family protein [Actinomycetota bacterium]